MGYWISVARSAWSNVKHFSPVKALPSIILAIYSARRDGLSTVGDWIRISSVVLGVYVLLAIVEFIGRALFVAPRRLHNQVVAELTELLHKHNELLGSKLEIMYSPEYPYDDQRLSGPNQPISYRLFRVGIRNIGTKTVSALRVQISDLAPRPEWLYTPLLLPAMHDRPGAATTELHPNGEPWYFDVVDQQPTGVVRITHTVGGIGNVLPPDKYTITLSASGRDVPSVSRRFLISVPNPQPGNQDLLFSPYA